MHLMIPGPVPCSPDVLEACSGAPPSHVAPDFVATFGGALRGLREVFLADASSQPFVLPGAGTLAMEAAATNVVAPGDKVVQVVTGLFGDRMAEMLRRRGADVVAVRAPVGQPVPVDAVREAVVRHRPVALFATHVDTSTGVLTDPRPLAALAAEHGALSIFDGVCAAAGEQLEQAEWGVDVVLTASQKALSVPPGLALWNMSERAMARRQALNHDPPMTLDALEWLGVMKAYEEGRGAYFSTPATTLVRGLATSIASLAREGMGQVFARHVATAEALRRAWAALGLQLVAPAGHQAHTLSALRYPDGVDASLLAAIKTHGVVVAGGLHPELRTTTFRVGHMGYATTQPDMLRETVRAVAAGLKAVGHDVDAQAALDAFEG